MHVMLSWDISAQGDRWKLIDKLMVEALKPHSWVRPLKTVYVLRLADEAERKALRERLIEAAKSVPEKVLFLMTPAMAGGSYNGFLPSDAWPKIQERSK
jgi:hypothetical protein